ncbi:uncharacterized protein [Paramisgurnus dabryanus]|uniref:uncharacterized protein isoform X1 n=1 Tax=Paramisgurnus dabryanus TaxID=90735 RepID=UPI003CCF8B31
MGEFEMTLLSICIHILTLGIAMSETCTPAECLICNSSVSEPCPQCFTNQKCYNDVPTHCRQAFNVTVTATPNPADKLKDVNVTCVHDLPRANISIVWIKNKIPIEENHYETLLIPRITEGVDVTCQISSICGNFSDTETITLTTDNSTVVILICVAGAFGLLLIFGIVMKITQRSGQVQREARKRQREQNIQNIHSTATVTTNYW